MKKSPKERSATNAFESLHKKLFSFNKIAAQTDKIRFASKSKMVPIFTYNLIFVCSDLQFWPSNTNSNARVKQKNKTKIEMKLRMQWRAPHKEHKHKLKRMLIRFDVYEHRTYDKIHFCYPN